jgi:hypothetical protein
MNTKEIISQDTLFLLKDGMPSIKNHDLMLQIFVLCL